MENSNCDIVEPIRKTDNKPAPTDTGVVMRRCEKCGQLTDSRRGSERGLRSGWLCFYCQSGR
jgi:hypothetical protein